MRPGHICRLGAIAGRMACILAAALLACASSAHSQVIEKGGFPVKEDGLSGEPFSLSCPPRLYVAAGNPFFFRVLRQRYPRRAFATSGSRSRTTGFIF